MIFIEYPKCTTCIKARNYLLNKNIKFESRNIKENNPSFEELKKWKEKFNLDIKKMFNTSGLLYKDLNLKEKLNEMSDDEKLRLLSTNGMLVKRPILLTDSYIIFGFKENDWEKIVK